MWSRAATSAPPQKAPGEVASLVRSWDGDLQQRAQNRNRGSPAVAQVKDRKAEGQDPPPAHPTWAFWCRKHGHDVLRIVAESGARFPCTPLMPRGWSFDPRHECHRRACRRYCPQSGVEQVPVTLGRGEFAKPDSFYRCRAVVGSDRRHRSFCARSPGFVHRSHGCAALRVKFLDSIQSVVGRCSTGPRPRSAPARQTRKECPRQG